MKKWLPTGPWLISCGFIGLAVLDGWPIPATCLLCLILFAISLVLTFWMYKGADGQKQHDLPAPVLYSTVLLCSIFMGSASINYWPLQIGWQIQQGSLSALANRVAKGERPMNVWAGPFVIEDVGFGYNSRTVFLWTDLHPSGKSGFCQGTAEECKSSRNLFHQISLSSEWQFVWED